MYIHIYIYIQKKEYVAPITKHVALGFVHGLLKGSDPYVARTKTHIHYTLFEAIRFPCMYVPQIQKHNNIFDDCMRICTGKQA